ncbi:hypothetical protein LR48_Vigan03g081800 [Vigna angularis]|uniref:Uncharacterized protein n=1 Tax=Phaseolus angularis TaxID=3914 RepID=A0A0L9U3S5_PHAAN|nr:hypothetical protein LR48_Vigan03g081800 [Vigna angularis]
MSSYENLVGVKLKLKGTALDVAGGVKKKNNKRNQDQLLQVAHYDSNRIFYPDLDKKQADKKQAEEKKNDDRSNAWREYYLKSKGTMAEAVRERNRATELNNASPETMEAKEGRNGGGCTEKTTMANTREKSKRRPCCAFRDGDTGFVQNRTVSPSQKSSQSDLQSCMPRIIETTEIVADLDIGSVQNRSVSPSRKCSQSDLESMRKPHRANRGRWDEGWAATGRKRAADDGGRKSDGERHVVHVETSSGAISGGEEWRFAIYNSWRFGWWLVVEIRWQCCWSEDDLAGVRVKMMKIGGRGIARDRVEWWRENEGEMRR